MATLVSFHAHPDDECIACGGIIRKAADEGHRVVLVVATRGENGEIPEGLLDPGEELWQRRVAETHASAAILGAQRVEFLGCTDSGMMGTPANDAPGSFWTANLNRWDGTEPNRRMSNWSDPLQPRANPHVPSRFGQLVFVQ